MSSRVLGAAEKADSTPGSDASVVRAQSHTAAAPSDAVAAVLSNPSLLAAVMARVSDVREKVRLQRVCRRWRSVAREAGAWAGADRLALTDPDNGADRVAVNDAFLVAVDALPDVLEALLARMRLRELDLSRCTNDTVFELVAAQLISAQSVVQLDTLAITGRGKDTYLVQFISAFRRNVSHLLIGNCTFGTRVPRVWRSIKECHQLSVFQHLRFQGQVDIFSLEPDVLDAMRGKQLSKLSLFGLRNLTPAGVVEILRGLSPGCLRHLELDSRNVSLRTLSEHVDPSMLAGVHTFAYGAFSADGSEDRMAAVVPDAFPNLRRCIFDHSNRSFSPAAVVDTIDRFLARQELLMLNSHHTTETDEERTVVLTMPIQDSHALDEVLGQAIRERRCRVSPEPRGAQLHFLVERRRARLLLCNADTPMHAQLVGS